MKTLARPKSANNVHFELEDGHAIIRADVIPALEGRTRSHLILVGCDSGRNFKGRAPDP
jgi:hypothetical protein